ncbi:MAG: carbohydrate kinase family protein [Desulfurococcales archaeon]|nr:carbohydrate kinase family protein [Desulfurococcales archaeon]
MILVAGSLNYDITLYVDRFAPPKSVVKKIKRFLGGSGGNAAVAAARILGRGKVFLLSAVGNDEIGRAHIRALRDEGVLTTLVKVIDDAESGQAFVIINKSGESAIYSYYGANACLTPEEVRDDVASVLEKVSYVLIMNPPLPIASMLVKLAQERGRVILWDPGVLSNLGLSKLADIIKATNYLLPNREELLILTDSKNETEAVEKLLKMNPELKLVIKEGARGVKYVDLKNRVIYLIGGVPLRELGFELASTVGCGDTLVGAFTALKSMGYSDIEALKLSNCAAAINASKEEPRGSPRFNELIKLFKNKCSQLISTRITELDV